MTLATEVQSLTPTAIVTLYELDATAVGGPTFRWHNGVNEKLEPVVWQGNTYTPAAIVADGFEWSAKGPLPRPTLRVANLDGYMSGIMDAYDDLLGAKVIRRRTLLKYLDAVNFDAGNPDADPNTHFSDEIFYIDRRSVENEAYIEVELTVPFDVEGISLPRRQVIANVCPWVYKGAECGYTGTSYFDANDNPVGSSQDVCGKRISSCRARHPEPAELPYGGFPGAGIVTNSS